jgi:hypothetical protein
VGKPGTRRARSRKSVAARDPSLTPGPAERLDQSIKGRVVEPRPAQGRLAAADARFSGLAASGKGAG